MRTAVVLSLLLLPVFAPADEALELDVRPMLCITDENTPVCDLSFLVNWKSRDAGYYCLFNDFTEAPLRCWEAARRGEMEDKRIVEQDFDYWMSEQGKDAKLVSVTVEVLRMHSDDRRRNRRTRHVWDLL